MTAIILPLSLITCIYQKKSVVRGLLIWHVFLFTTTEILSFLHCLNAGFVTVLWFMFETCFLVIIFLKKGTKLKPGKVDPLWVIPAVMLLFLLFLAVFTVPYNYDSMCYHLPRIMFWKQNASVDYYVTNDQRQLVTSPFTEYVQLHVQLMCENDSMLNLVSFGAALVSVYLIYRLTVDASGSKKAGILAAIMYLSTPVIEAECISTQVDVFASMWVLVCTRLIYDLAKDKELKPDKKGLKKVIYLGIAMGLCFITKTNACIPVAVMLIWLLMSRIKKKDKMRVMLEYIIIALAVALFFAIPSFVRNYGLTGDILAAKYMGSIAVGSFAPAYLLVNLLKNFVLLGVLANRADNPFRSMQIFLVKGAARVLGVDINDPRISFVTGETAFQDNTALSYEHDHAGAQLLMVLFILFPL